MDFFFLISTLEETYVANKLHIQKALEIKILIVILENTGGELKWELECIALLCSVLENES